MVGLSEKVYKLLLKINYAVEKINEIFIPWNLCWGFSLSVIDTALISKWNVASNYQIWALLLCNVHISDKMLACV